MSYVGLAGLGRSEHYLGEAHFDPRGPSAIRERRLVREPCPICGHPTGDCVTHEEMIMAENQVPDGTAKEVLAWVGDDPERAKQALEAETAEDGKDRDSVREPLKKMLDEAGESTEDTPPEPSPGAQDTTAPPGAPTATANPSTQEAANLSVSPDPILQSQDAPEELDEGFVRLDEPLKRKFLPPNAYTPSAHLVAGVNAIVPESLIEETEKHNKQVEASAEQARKERLERRAAATDDTEGGEDE